MSFLVRTAVATSLIGLSSLIATTSARAQHPIELRTDFFRFDVDDGDGGNRIQLVFPGALAIAFYMNPQVALEPRFAIVRDEDDDDNSATQLAAGLFLPIHFQPGGRQGFFVSPGLQVTHFSSDPVSDTFLDYGLDLGVKWAVRDRISSRLAFTIRDGDSTDDAELGLTFGVGLFWR